MLINAEMSIGKRTGAEFAEGAIKYESPIKLTKDSVVRARTMDGGQWSALVEHQFQSGRAGTPLRLTEIMYNPPGGSEYEFVELHNSGDSEVPLGWYRFDGIDYTFDGDATIAPGQYIVLASDDDPDAFKLRYPGLPVYGWYKGSLSNGGERLTLLDMNWRRVVEVDFSDGGAWPRLADGDGHSLELIDLLADPGAASNWASSAAKAGSPGQAGAGVGAPAVIINEVHVRSADGSEQDFIELRNLGQAEVDLEGWVLRDGGGNKFTLPKGASLGQAGLLGIWCGRGMRTAFVPTLALARGETRWRCLMPMVAVWTPLRLVASTDPSSARTTAGRLAARPSARQTNRSHWPTRPRWSSTSGWPSEEGGSDWIELYNPHPTAPALITGLHIRVGQEIGGLHRIAAIPPKGHQRVRLDMKSGTYHVDLSLPTEGGTITLITAEGIEFATMSYNRQRSGVSEGLLPDGSAKRTKFTRGATPGAPNIVPDFDGPRLNELLAYNRSGAGDWVEIYNDTDETVSLDGVRLARSANGIGWPFPAGTRLAKGGYLVVLCDGNRPASSTNTGFSLPAEGGGLYLIDPDGFVADSVEYGFQIADRTIGQSGKWRLLNEPTPGAENATTASFGDPLGLVINEWMANPASGDDWFELFNPSESPVNLGGLSLTDDPTAVGRAKFVIPENSFIPAGGWVRGWPMAMPGRCAPRQFQPARSRRIAALYGSRRNPIDEVEIVNQADGISRGRLPDGASAYADFPDTPTPGASNYLPLLDVVINEVLAHTDAPLEDAIEIRNISDTEINVGGWLLGDTPSGATRLRFQRTQKSPPAAMRLLRGQLQRGRHRFQPELRARRHGLPDRNGRRWQPTGYRVVQPSRPRRTAFPLAACRPVRVGNSPP